MTQHQERLRHNILFETISDSAFRAVASKMEEKQFPAGTVILEDDASGSELFLLVDGRVTIIKQTKTGENKMLALLHAGDFFGELELIDGRTRSARVTALDTCTVYTLNKFEFDELLTKNHPFALRVMQVLSLRLRATNNHFISELEKHNQQWKQEIDKLQKLIEATKNVNSTLDLDKLLKIILDTALNIVEGDRGTLYLVDEQKKNYGRNFLSAKNVLQLNFLLGKELPDMLLRQVIR